jgi:hypothetical protein
MACGINSRSTGLLVYRNQLRADRGPDHGERRWNGSLSEYTFTVEWVLDGKLAMSWSGAMSGAKDDGKEGAQDQPQSGALLDLCGPFPSWLATLAAECHQGRWAHWLQRLVLCVFVTRHLLTTCVYRAHMNNCQGGEDGSYVFFDHQEPPLRGFTLELGSLPSCRLEFAPMLRLPAGQNAVVDGLQLDLRVRLAMHGLAGDLDVRMLGCALSRRLLLEYLEQNCCQLLPCDKPLSAGLQR